MDYLAKMIEELQKAQEYASQNAPLVPHKEELAEADAEPRLDLSANKVDAAASALRGSEEATAEEPPALDANRVVAPGLDDEEPRTNTVVTPSPDYFDTTPNPQPGDAMRKWRFPARSSPTRSFASRESRFWTRARRPRPPRTAP